ncbi:E3 ubiquitin-protein ligase TRIM4-like [Oryzias latipes]|uniref:B30.2/SPRY domain-containing protein n=1 Tax=Oryzias latipes TaxID=8090 RepID=A0A3B3IGU8_ORYLA|nr:E3 ubiquitin-protein ligase TRIM4-like [Oryzias latipes]
MSFYDQSTNGHHQESDEELKTADWDAKHPKGKDFLKPIEPEKRSISPLSLLKEDLTQFKEGVLKVFKDKDANSRVRQSQEKSNNPLANLKEDLSNVFKVGLSKERGNKDNSSKADSSRAENPLNNLFRREKNLLEKTQKPKDVKDIKEQTKDSREILCRQNKGNAEGSDTKNVLSQSKHSNLDTGSAEEKVVAVRGLIRTQQCETALNTVSGGKEDDPPVESPSLESLPPKTTLLSLINFSQHHPREQAEETAEPAEDPWSLKNFACYLTLDPNTANSELCLTERNRKATRVWLNHHNLEHPERFEHCPQVLCREGLLDKVYWEVMWKGGADIGVAYNKISRNSNRTSCLLGHNQWSWSLECSEGNYTPCHNKKRFASSSPDPFSHRVGIYLNWPAGSLSFYSVSQEAMVHLYTFTSTFTEPLYPGFWVWSSDGFVSLCQVEMDWERLLQ